MILEDLNPEQRRAAEAVRGPVCILAGAGSGKTTTITRRIANQVATGAFEPTQILAVTFTDKAATELRSRLASLGATGVTARTFHSAALAQLRFFAPDRVGGILASKAILLRQIGNMLPGAYRFRPAGDLATEVEWAKNRGLTPQTYLTALGDHLPPIPPDLMARVFREYERRKTAANLVDFEDLLRLAIELYDENEWALATFRERYRAFTVDEYQDVNLLQQTLLEGWLGSSDELCAVGDDYQSIYSFTGATPEYLLALPQRFPHATVVRLEENYRSSPEVLELTNRLVPRLGGAPKKLRTTRPSGPAPELRGFSDPQEEAQFVVERVRALGAEGVSLEEMAILLRTNARSADFEETLHAADIPFQGASLLAREGARGLLKRLRGASGPAESVVRRVARELGWLESPPEGLGEREQTRQDDLRRIVAVAARLEDVSELEAELEQLFGSGASRGVHLLTLHRAKGLEFDAVFLPRLEEGELPIRQAKTEVARNEERRLLYVGMTRARRHLALTWAGRPSRFLDEFGVETRPPRVERRRLRDEELPPAARALRAWRLERARADAVPAYVVFDDRTLEEIVRRSPESPDELAAVPGIGPARLERYGSEVLAVLSAA
ncbi:MAG TPA: ATP-dependent DNA helicase UvrD2 [Gaiellaceae bacterium]|nr:ATP-dependent DNA helicase UvrD2 [Gaiellaceae bacterium]